MLVEELKGLEDFGVLKPVMLVEEVEEVVQRRLVAVEELVVLAAMKVAVVLVLR